MSESPAHSNGLGLLKWIVGIGTPFVLAAFAALTKKDSDLTETTMENRVIAARAEIKSESAEKGVDRVDYGVFQINAKLDKHIEETHRVNMLMLEGIGEIKTAIERRNQ